ncbi:roadblock/LC7 domain-containing protein [Nocardiopsis metallicus]|uniref:Putative regulator of Ras-like GTPase activity (Roadblock/LC7/MglB family) n=1 Tax=Nocardiopsis metallicus TaxID=179819 RepID=A0A840WHU5_9ACTN|nr:roadblock/LC7 domain-containing protein [Nocardiopsis metallicus]MBB5491485.1 putative regulator of Ras-like GTPase activity (Roadblock/LC7/MglB family) [Nocardiopsis metallicus]
MAEHTPSPPRTVPDLLSDFVHTTPGADHVVVFTHDSLVHAYSSGLSMQHAEQWSALLGGLWSMADRWARVVDRGACDHILHKDQAGRVLILPATPGCGIGLLLSADADIKKVAFAAQTFVDSLGSRLPQEVPTTVGAALHLRGERAA